MKNLILFLLCISLQQASFAQSNFRLPVGEKGEKIILRSVAKQLLQTSDSLVLESGESIAFFQMILLEGDHELAMKSNSGWIPPKMKKTFRLLKHGDRVRITHIGVNRDGKRIRLADLELRIIDPLSVRKGG